MSAACGLTTDDEADTPEAPPAAPGPKAPTQAEPSPQTALPEPEMPEPAPGSEAPSEEVYDGAPICVDKSPFEEMPVGCPSNRPSAGSECPPESSGARCPGGTQKLGDHYRQTVMYCESSVWVERSQPCSNECSARGPNAIDLPDDCGSRRVVDCRGESLSSLVRATISLCEHDAFNNQVQVEVEDGCPRVVSSDRALSRCAIDALSSTRWECGSGFTCAKASFLLL